MNLEGYDADRFADRIADGPDRAELDLPERWILSRVQRAAEEVDSALEEYRIADAAQAAYHFVWDELCDWYIELAKAALRARRRPTSRRAAKIQGALVTALETAMRLLHPFMPFITEEIWQQLPEAVGRAPEHHDHALPGARRALPSTTRPRRRWRWCRRSSSRCAASAPSRTSRPSARVTALLAVSDDYKKTILEGYKHDHRRAGAVRRGARAPRRRQLLGRVRARPDRDGDGRATSR